jgi:hypothetical protein
MTKKVHEELELKQFYESKYYIELSNLAKNSACELYVGVIEVSKAYSCFYYSEIQVLLLKDGCLLNSSDADDEEGAMQAWTGLVLQEKKNDIPTLLVWKKDEEFVQDLNKLIDLVSRKAFQKSKLRINN